ncbi:MAG: PIN domain nuclease [Bifidobacteriaceae bacterium]|nr:PIN domain nuclease [Bifidobacteriaceae bacterium]
MVNFHTSDPAPGAPPAQPTPVILADSSAWIDYLAGTDGRQVRRLASAIADGTVVVGDLIMTEVLRGIRSDAEFALVREAMTALPMVGMLGPERAVTAAQHYRSLRRRGVTVRKTADVVIASYCITEGLALLFTDRDFEPFVEHLGLMRA